VTDNRMRSIFVLLPWLFLTGLVALVFASWWTNGIVAELVSSDLSSADRVVQLQQFFRRMNTWAPLAYVVFVIVEVIIAPIPGLMLYAPGGLIFGPWLGGLLAVIGNLVVVAMIVARLAWRVAPESS